MLNLTMKALPDTVLVDGRAFFINTDYRIWIQFEREAMTGKPFDWRFIFRDEYPIVIEDTSDILKFARPERKLPRPMHRNDAISLDFDIDADYIYAAFMEQYGIDLIDIEHLHWWKFIALLNGLSENTTLSKIMGYRNYKKQNGKRDPYEDLRRAWEIIPEPNEEEAAEIAEFESQFQ